ncbi:MAG: shikimate kinase [bacterium]|nr:shikimate kinase [bacterium]
MNNIILLGFMGSGKTAVGKLLAAKLQKDFIDLDDWIEKEAEMTINEIFDKNGEAYFRELEKKIVEKAGKILTNTVISTGGGVILRERNTENLHQAGVLIWLKVSPEKVYERTKNAGHRPLLNCPDPLGKIKELLSFRTPYYTRAADYIIDTSNLTVEEIVAKIIEYLK